MKRAELSMRSKQSFDAVSKLRIAVSRVRYEFRLLLQGIDFDRLQKDRSCLIGSVGHFIGLAEELGFGTQSDFFKCFSHIQQKNSRNSSDRGILSLVAAEQFAVQPRTGVIPVTIRGSI